MSYFDHINQERILKAEKSEGSGLVMAIAKQKTGAYDVGTTGGGCMSLVSGTRVVFTMYSLKSFNTKQFLKKIIKK